MEARDIPVGIVGLGLMGTSIAACLLTAGLPVVGVTPVPVDPAEVENHIFSLLADARKQGITGASEVDFRRRLLISNDYGQLKGCRLIIESTLENPGVKKQVVEKIEAVIAPDTLLTSNTSAILISLLQKSICHPERFLRLYWMKPAYTARFLEVICGEKSNMDSAEYLCNLARGWGKEPILVQKDIRGFITNRLKYALCREACFLVENGYATMESVGRACRNNAGCWMPPPLSR